MPHSKFIYTSRNKDNALMKAKRTSSVAKNRLEMQADNSAARVMNGETHVSRFLSATPSASYRFGASNGSHLPDHILSELESGFGVDLSNVLIHNSTQVNSIVTDHGASAFTSGRNIYFGRDEYHPTHEKGKALLFHEVAHVLQQTGKTSSAGTIAAPGGNGIGLVQFDDKVPVGDNILPGLIQKYKDEGVSSDTIKFMDEISLRLGGTLIQDSRNRITDEFADEIFDGKYDKTEKHMRSFLFDCCKLLGYPDVAVNLLEKDIDLKTTITSYDFLEYIQPKKDTELSPGGYDFSSFTSIIPSLAVTNPFWPDRFAFVIREFIFNPYRPIQSVPNLKAAADKLNTSTIGVGIGKLRDNERAILAFAYLSVTADSLEKKLQSIKSQVEKDAGTNGNNIISRQLRKSYKLKELGNNFIANGKSSPHDSFLTVFGGMIGMMADRGIVYWQPVLTKTNSIAEKAKGVILNTSDEFRKEFTIALPSHPAISDFKSKFETEATSFFAINADKTLPTPAEYKSKVKHFDKLMGELQESVSSEMGKLFANPQTPPANLDIATGLTMVLLLIEEIRTRLKAFDAAKDAKESAVKGNLADQRNGHRILMARNCFVYALLFGWKGLEEVSKKVLLAQDQNQSVLALIGDWEQKPADIEKLEEDFSNRMHTVFGNVPITARHIVKLYKYLSLQNLDDTIESQLEKEETILTGKRKDIIKTANEQLTKMHRPQRYQLTPFELALNSDDKRSINTLIQDHPKSQAFLEKSIDHKKWEGYIYPDVTTLKEVFVWLIPPLGSLVNILKKVPEINAIVTKGGELVAPDDPTQWILQLTQNIDENSDVIADTDAAINRVITEESGRNDALLRRVNTLRRRRAIPKLSKLLGEFIDGDIRDFEKPITVIDYVTDFEKVVQPDADKDAQLFAMMLGIAPAMKNAFMHEGRFAVIQTERFDIITQYFDYLRRVKEGLNDEMSLKIKSILHADEDYDTLVGVNFQYLQEVLAGFDEVRKRKQRESGFKSTDMVNIQNVKSNIPEEITPSTAFMIDGISYQLVSIENKFIYHPTYGAGTKAELIGTVTDLNNVPLDPGRILFIINVNETEQVVTARDIKELDKFSYVFTMQSIIMGLNSLAELIEASMELILDGVEFIPGIGQGVAIARASIAFAKFIAEELPAIKKHILNDPTEILHTIKDIIAGKVNLEAMLYFLLQPGNPNPFQSLKKKPPPQPEKLEPRGRLGKLIAAVKRIGILVFEAIMALKQSLGKTTLNAQTKVAESPILNYVLLKVPDIIYYVGIIAEAFTEGEDGKSIFEKLDPQNLSTSISELLQGLEELELPQEVFPLTLAVEIILAFLLSRFGAKGKALKTFLSGTGLLHKLSDPIASQIKGSDVDPNRLWQVIVLPKIDTYFTSLRNDLVEEIYSVVKTVFKKLDLDPIERPGVTEFPSIPAQKDLASQPFPEIESKPLNNSIHTFANPVNVSITQGEPLQSNLKKELETNFGHDFSHVRIHQGTDANQLTNHYQAKGLATGSHIFLRPGYVLESKAGRDVLNHELSHTLQQTGPRPLNKTYSSAPLPGKPGKGLQYNEHRENEADRMAKKSMEATENPVSVENVYGELPFQPSMESVALMGINILSHTGFNERLIAKVVTAEGFLAGSARTVPGLDKATEIWNTAVSLITAGGTQKEHSMHFKNDIKIQNAIKGKITANSKEIKAILPALAYLAQKNKRGPKGKTPEEKTELHLPYFVNYLEGYINAKLGIALNIHLDKVSGKVDSVGYKWINFSALQADDQILSILRANSPGFTDEEDWKSIVRLLQAPTPQPFILAIDKFAISTEFRARIVSFLRGVKSVKNLPEWNEYLNLKSTAQVSGIRIGTHGEMIALPDTIRGNRHSHHVPQYVLSQYFHNKASTRLFKSGTRLPGFSGEQNPKKFNSGGTTIDIESLESDRGANMPAVLLAADTHRRGKLHLNQDSTWDTDDDGANELGKTPRQSETLNRFFYGQLKKHLNFSGENEIDIAKQAMINPGTGTVAVFKAMKDSYSFIYKRMIDSLERAFPELEIPYYAAIAVRSHSDSKGKLESKYDPYSSKSPFDKIISTVKTKNDQVMKAWK